jgi:hypothetical protein
MLWSIWLSRDDIVFNKTSIFSYMIVIFRAIYWTRMWSVSKRKSFKCSLHAV